MVGVNGTGPRLLPVIGATVCMAVLAVARAAAPAAANETQVTASTVSGAMTTTASASAFRDSIGVNAGPSWFDTPYGDWPRVISKLRELGVDHIRASIVFSSNEGWNARFYGALNAAARAGIGFNLLVDFRCSYDGTMDPCLRAMKTRMPLASIKSVEWPNEHDISGDPNWLPSLTAWGRQLFAKMKADPALRSIPVVGPSLVYPSSHSAVGDQTAYVERGNLHPYMGGLSPNPGHLASVRQLAARVSGTKPIVVTEAGFHNALAQTNGDQPATNEAGAAVYTVRTVLEHYVAGLERTYIFQLIDYRNDPYTSHANFGLLRNDWSPKPAFTALKNLLTMVGRSGPAEVARLPYAISGDMSDLRQLVLQKGDGSHLLILWRTASVWNRDTQQSLAVVPKRYTLTLPSAVSAGAGDPVGSPGFMPVHIDGAGRTVHDIGADPLVLHVRSPGAGAPAGAVPVAGAGAAGRDATTSGAAPSAATAPGVADKRRPRVSRLRIRRVGRRYVAFFRVSEPARVTTRVDRARRGSRVRYRAVKRLTARQMRAGARTLSLGRLTRGRHRLVLTLRDAAGNRVGVARVFRVRSAGRR
jgi:hypothetical protein